MASFWFCATVTAISAYVSLGFSLAALGTSDGADRRGFEYAFVRSLALAVAATVVAVVQTRPWLQAVALTMVVLQAGDAVIGWMMRDRLRSVGPAATSVVNLAALVWVSSN
ncbi:MAG: hypothetical protein ABI775_04715 [Pseudonocardiales bacterium]